MFLERRPDYTHDGLIVDDENQSHSEPDEIAKRIRTNSHNDTSSDHANQGSRFSQRLKNNRNLLEEKRTSDQNSSNETECKYCKRAFGHSRLLVLKRRFI